MFGLNKRNRPPKVTSSINYPLLGGSLSLNVSESDLLKNPTAISCVEIIAKTISLLPINLYHKGRSGRVRAGWHPLHPVLRHRPNLDEPSAVFIEKVVRDMLVSGNAFLWKSYSSGNIDALYSLDPKQVKVYRNSDGRKTFEYADRSYTANEILHIPGAFYDGLIGHSPAKFAAEAVRMGVQLDSFAAEAFNNGPNSRLTLDISEKFPNGAKPDDVKAVASYVARNYAGKENAGKPLILFDKMKAAEIKTSSNRDAELVEARKYQERVIAKVFQVPLSMLGDSEAGYGDLENRQISFLTYGLGPWIRRLEQYFEMLLTPSENISYYVEFDTNVLLKSNLEARTKAYATMLQSGILSVNEVRKRENLDAIEDDVAGNAHFVLSNLMPLSEDIIESYMSNAKLKQKELEMIGQQPQPKTDKKANP